MKRLLMIGLGMLLAGCGARRSTSDWIRDLQAKDVAIRLRAIKVLAEPGCEKAAAVPALAGALQDRNAFVRRDAAIALGKIGPDARRAVPSLAALLKDKEPSVSKAAAAALRKIGEKKRAWESAS